MKQLSSFFLILILSALPIFGQKALSDKATISVVTCGSGNELYSAFGHSAFRVFDPIQNIDIVYNYGTFNFNAPNFYLNFAKGKLIYQLSTQNFSRFLRIYQYENRWVKTQVLNLSHTDIEALFNFLETNAKPENRKYRYDFFYDNCSTKIEEVLVTVLKDKISFSNTHISTNKSHRDLIQDYTLNNKWGKFGIDLALGSVIDDEATKDEYKFLPDYVLYAFNNATINYNGSIEPLVKKEISILKEKPAAKTYNWMSPINTLLAISLVIIFITYKNYKDQNRSKWLDFTSYFLTGIIGVVVLLLWFATDHTATYKNLNFLWAFAPNSIAAFFMIKTKLPNWIILYNKFLIMLLLAILPIWLLKIQVFNTAFISLFIALFIRYLFIIQLQRKLNL